MLELSSQQNYIVWVYHLAVRCSSWISSVSQIRGFRYAMWNQNRKYKYGTWRVLTQVYIPTQNLNRNFENHPTSIIFSYHIFCAPRKAMLFWVFFLIQLNNSCQTEMFFYGILFHVRNIQTVSVGVVFKLISFKQKKNMPKFYLQNV